MVELPPFDLEADRYMRFEIPIAVEDLLDDDVAMTIVFGLMQPEYRDAITCITIPPEDRARYLVELQPRCGVLPEAVAVELAFLISFAFGGFNSIEVQPHYGTAVTLKSFWYRGGSVLRFLVDDRTRDKPLDA